jgi:hypothetical protein
MADNSKKVSELPTASNVASTDRVLVLRSPASGASVRTVAFSTLSANLIVSNTVPATATANGNQGTIAFDSDYFYVCVANNVWKRSSLTTW